MTRFIVGVLVAAIALLALAAGLIVGGPAFAQSGTHGDGHAEHHHDFYRHWMQPGVTPAISCCNARVEKDGREVGDCEPTRAEVRNGQWFAWLRQEGRWLPIPDAKIVRERNPNIFDAHLCWTKDSGVLCFSPPDTGG